MRGGNVDLIFAILFLGFLVLWPSLIKDRPREKSDTEQRIETDARKGNPFRYL